MPDRREPGKGCKGKTLAGGCGGRPPQQTSPFSWPGEGGQVEDYARRGDEVDQFVDLTSIVWKSPQNRLLMSRMASGPFQFKGMDEGNTPKSEMLHWNL